MKNMKKWECMVCGTIHDGEEPPEKCPACGAGRDKFVEITDSIDAAAETGQDTDSQVRESVEPDTATQSQSSNALIEMVSGLIIKNHLHPISVHTPNGIVPIAVVFLVLSIVAKYPILDSAAYFNMIAAMLVMPVVLLSGIVAWQKKYNGAITTVFQIKIAAGFIATSSLFLLVAWRTIQPDILSSGSAGRWLFMLLAFILLGSVGIAGHLGGQLVFTAKK